MIVIGDVGTDRYGMSDPEARTVMTYGENGECLTEEYYEGDELMSSTVYSYGEDGVMLSRTVRLSDGNVRETFFDAQGRITGGISTYPEEGTLTYTYDEKGMVTEWTN